MKRLPYPSQYKDVVLPKNISQFFALIGVTKSIVIKDSLRYSEIEGLRPTNIHRSEPMIKIRKAVIDWRTADDDLPQCAGYNLPDGSTFTERQFEEVGFEPFREWLKHAIIVEYTLDGEFAWAGVLKDIVDDDKSWNQLIYHRYEGKYRAGDYTIKSEGIL